MKLPSSNFKMEQLQKYIELWFLWSACHLMMLYISMKLHENILNGFQVTEQTHLLDRQIDRPTDNQGKNIMSPPLSCTKVTGFSSIFSSQNITFHSFI